MSNLSADAPWSPDPAASDGEDLFAETFFSDVQRQGPQPRRRGDSPSFNSHGPSSSQEWVPSQTETASEGRSSTQETFISREETPPATRTRKGARHSGQMRAARRERSENVAPSENTGSSVEEVVTKDKKVKPREQEAENGKPLHCIDLHETIQAIERAQAQAPRGSRNAEDQDSTTTEAIVTEARTSGMGSSYCACWKTVNGWVQY